MIVYDFFSRAGNLAADEMGIPSVNFFIGPLIIFKEFCLYDTPDFKNARTCCGCICVKKPRDRGCIKILMDASPYAEFYKRHNERSVIINSFWGIEKCESVPPNIVFTGPLVKPSESLMEDFEKKDKDLFEWMNKAYDLKKDVVIVTIGSECKWQ